MLLNLHTSTVLLPTSLFSEPVIIFIMDPNSPSEPTQVLSMMGAFHTQMRHSTSGSRLSMSNTQGEISIRAFSPTFSRVVESSRAFIGFIDACYCVSGKSIKRSLATRLAFDETMEPEPESMRKVSRLEADLLSSSRHGLRRFTSENFDKTSKLSSDNEDLRARLKDLEAASAGDRAKVASMETKMRSLELELGAVKLVNREKYKTLNCKVEQMKKRQSDILH